MSSPNIWYPVPAGKCNPNDAPSSLKTKVLVRFQQHDQDYCLLHSFANALDYIGMSLEARIIAKNIKREIKDRSLDSGLDLIKLLVSEHVPSLANYETFGMLAKKKKKSTNRHLSIEQLCREKTPYPTIVIPSGNDGSVNHAVCVVDDLVFDSTQNYALKLKKGSFDFAVGPKGASGIFGAIRFYRPNKKGIQPMRREMKNNW
jgi:hypothetical protein